MVLDHQAQELPVTRPLLHINHSKILTNFPPSLAAVNFFLGIVGLIQITRIATHEPSTAADSVKAVVEDVKQEAREIKAEVKENIKA